MVSYSLPRFFGGTRMNLIILLDAIVLHARFIALYFLIIHFYTIEMRQPRIHEFKWIQRINTSCFL
jgi:hypothetical protein